MLQVCLRLREDSRNLFHAFPQIREALHRRRKIARHDQVETVGEALVVNEWIPLALFQLFDSENFVVDVVSENPHVDAIGRI